MTPDLASLPSRQGAPSRGAPASQIRAKAALTKRSRSRRRRARDGVEDFASRGFDTADLKDAKALLDELSGSP
jgi:hypothetical protein